jgi:hypothetical protein
MANDRQIVLTLPIKKEERLMFTRSKPISILTTLGVLLLIHMFATSAFAVCSACVSNTITCTAGTISNTDPTTNWRPLTTGGGTNICASGTAPCGTSTPGPFRYDVYTFTNNTGGATPDCFTVTLTNACGVSMASFAFSPSFDPTASTNGCTLNPPLNFTLTVSNTTSGSYSFNVANGQTITIVAMASGSNTVCTAGGTYTLAITPCPNGTGPPTAATSAISGRITATDGSPLEGTVASLSGTQVRKTITDENGNYRFENVEANGFYTLLPFRANYIFNPGNRSFSQLGNSTEALFTGSPTKAGISPIDTPEYFVRQHYIDFLGREPDESGFNFWSDQILGCGNDVTCTERKEINVSAAYFLSIEFQETGGLVDGLYRASYGRRPLYAEFMPDAQTVAQNVTVGRPGWQQQLSQNKQAFLDDWVQRSAFRATYDLLTNDHYVDTLIANTGVSFAASERDELVMGLALGSLSRTDVLQRIAQDDRFAAQKRNETFVMMEYFGYLRRDPDELGFQFWLNKLNQFNGNFEQAEMVKAFLVSGEFRSRFPN